MESATAIQDDLNSSEFLKELKSGSSQALERLDEALTSHLIWFLQFVMGVPEADAEELACDVLFTVSSHIQTFQHGGRAKLTTWVFEIAKNRAIDFHRKSRPEEVAIRDDFPDSGAAGSCAGRNKHLLCWLDEQLQSLEEGDRALLLWRAVEIPYSQIAEWLGITEGAARTRHSRSQAKLVNAARTAKPKGAVSE